jgi:hypothetical protein
VTLLITVGAIGFLLFALAALLVLPAVLAALPSENAIATVIGWLRWPTMLVLTTLAIMTLLRFGPSRKEAHWGSILRGSLIGAALWIMVSLAFAWYAQNIANFSALYGSLGSAVDMDVAVGAGGSNRRRIRRRRDVRPTRTPARRRAGPSHGKIEDDLQKEIHSAAW